MLSVWILCALYLSNHVHIKAQPQLVDVPIQKHNIEPYNSVGLLETKCYRTQSSNIREKMYSTGIIIDTGSDAGGSFDHILTAASNIWKINSHPNQLCDDFMFWAGLNEPPHSSCWRTAQRPRPCVPATHKSGDVSTIWMQQYIDDPKSETDYVIIKWYKKSSVTRTWKPLKPTVHSVTLLRSTVSGEGKVGEINTGKIVAYTGAPTGPIYVKEGSVKFIPNGIGLFGQSMTQLTLKREAVGGALVINQSPKTVIGMFIGSGNHANTFLRFTKTITAIIDSVLRNILPNKYTFSKIDVFSQYGIRRGVPAGFYVEWGDQLKPVKPNLMNTLPFAATGLLVHHCNKDYNAAARWKKPRPKAVGVGSVIKSERAKDGSIYDYILTVGHNVWKKGGDFDTRATHSVPEHQLCNKYEFYMGLNEPRIYQNSDVNWERVRRTRMTHDSAGVEAIYMPWYDGSKRGTQGEGWSEYDWAVIKWKKVGNEKSPALQPYFYKKWQDSLAPGPKIKTLIAAYDPFNGRPFRNYDPFGWAYRAMSSTVDVRVKGTDNINKRIWVHGMREMFVKQGMSGSPLVLREGKSKMGNRKQIGIMVSVNARLDKHAKYVRITKEYYQDIMKILNGKMEPTFTRNEFSFVAHAGIKNYYEGEQMIDDSFDEVETGNGARGNEVFSNQWISWELIMISVFILCCGCMGFGCGVLVMFNFTNKQK